MASLDKLLIQAQESRFLLVENNMNISQSQKDDYLHLLQFLQCRVQNFDVANTLTILSVLVDWRQLHLDDPLSYFLAKVDDSAHTPLLMINGFALLGCYIVSWMREYSEVEQNEMLSSLDTLNANPLEIMDSFDQQLNDPVLEFIWQLFESSGRLFRQTLLSEDTWLEFFNLSFWVFESGAHKNTLWIDDLDRCRFRSLHIFLSHFGYHVKELTDSSKVQKDDHIIIFTHVKSAFPRTVPSGLLKYNEFSRLGCRMLIICDSGAQRIEKLIHDAELCQDKEDFRSEEDRHMLKHQPLIISRTEITNKMFQYIRSKMIKEISKSSHLEDSPSTMSIEIFMKVCNPYSPLHPS